MMDRTAWLQARKAGIGGSDISAVLGLSKWRTPLDVWFDKTGRAEPTEPNEAMQWGTLLEDVVADEYSRRTSRRVQRLTAIVQHPEHPICLGSIDRAIVPEGQRARIGRGGWVAGAEGVLEVKTASAHAAEQWEDETGAAIPVHYAAQGQWYLGVTGLPWCEFAVLLGGQRMVTRLLHRDDELIRYMIERAEAWWREYVEANTMPPAANAADVLRLHPRDTGRREPATPALRMAVEQLRDVRLEQDRLKVERDAIEERIKLAMGDAAELVSEDGSPLVTWKAAKDSLVTDWPAVAAQLGRDLTPEQFVEVLMAHTSSKPGSRRFIVK
jgi:putative phage-type endonuclease